MMKDNDTLVSDIPRVLPAPDLRGTIGLVENTHLQQFLFLLILLMLLAAGVQGMGLIDRRDDPLTLQAFVFMGISLAGCLMAYLLTLQKKTTTAAWVLIASLTLPVLLRAWGSGLGIRTPVIYLLAPSILIAYYVLGQRISQLMALGACVVSIALYAAEYKGLIPGWTSTNAPSAALNLICLWIVIVCGLTGANAIRERKEHAIDIAHQRHALLQKTLADIETAEASQQHFLNQITRDVAAHVQKIDAAAHSMTANLRDPDKLRQGFSDIQAASQAMLDALNAAAEQTERETAFLLTEDTAESLYRSAGNDPYAR